MFQKAFCLTLMALFCFVVYVSMNIGFLGPYKRLLWHEHGLHMALFLGLMGVHICAVYVMVANYVNRSGFALRHLSKEAKDGKIIAELEELRRQP